MRDLKIFNEEVIPVYATDTNEKIVYGRDLHERLGIKRDYTHWFEDMIMYGFQVEADYQEFWQNGDEVIFDIVKFKSPQQASRLGYSKNHILKMDMAKHIAMIQRSPIGMTIRQKLIDLENEQSTPTSYKEALLRIIQQIEEKEKLEAENKYLLLETKVKDQQINELKPKASYYDLILQCKDLISITKIAKDYGKSGQWFNSKLHELGVQYKQGKIWLLYGEHADKGYTHTKTHYYMFNGEKCCNVQTYWTQAGRLFIYDLLKKEGILPTMEKAELAKCS